MLTPVPLWLLGLLAAVNGACLLVLACALWGSMRARRARRQPVRKAPAAPPIDPLIEAVERLERLERGAAGGDGTPSPLAAVLCRSRSSVTPLS